MAREDTAIHREQGRRQRRYRPGSRPTETRPPGVARLLLGSEKSLTERDWTAVKMLLPFFLEFKGRLAVAFACLAAIQASQLSIPFLLKLIIDDLDSSTAQIVALPLALLIVYVLVRFGSTASANCARRSSAPSRYAPCGAFR